MPRKSALKPPSVKKKAVTKVTRRDVRSGFEHKVAKYLDAKKTPYEYENLKVSYIEPSKKRTYLPDFVLPNGIIIEVKGKFDRESRSKMALVIEQNPDLDIRLLFMRDNKLTKKAKMRYSGWCEKRGIKYAVSEEGHVPDEWLLEKGAKSND